MTEMTLSFRGRQTAPNARTLVVFAHGFNSTSWSNFAAMLIEIRRLDQNKELIFGLADYPTSQGLRALGAKLGELVLAQEPHFDDIVLVGYSMGGLVARLAVLERNLPKVTRVVTLASPNQGVFTPGQLSLGAQMLLNNGFIAGVVERRATGVHDLQRAPKVMKAAVKDAGANLRQRVGAKTYITIPATYFHEGRNFWEAAQSTTMKTMGAALAAVNVVTGYYMRKYTGLGGTFVKFEKPHDGLVVSRSSRLHPPYAGHTSEAVSVQPNLTGQAPPNLAHFQCDECNEVDHVSLLHSREMAEMVYAAIVAPEPDKAPSYAPGVTLPWVD